MTGDYALLAGVLLGVNLLPAFGPPTWTVLVFFRVQRNMPAVPLVAVGALAAASGRLLLAHASRRFPSRLSKRRVTNLDAAKALLAGGRKRTLLGLALFALSPVPSAQLFIAAGLMRVRLLPLTVAFFGGRLASYSLYVGLASAARHNLRSVLSDVLGAPLGIALQILAVAALVVLFRVDWAGCSRVAASGQDVG